MSLLSQHLAPLLYRTGIKRYAYYETCPEPWASLGAMEFPRPLLTVVHVGAHFAEERLCYEKLGAKTIIWIEGSKETYRHLECAITVESHRGLLRADHVPVHALLTDRHGDLVDLYSFARGGAVKTGLTTIYKADEATAREHPFDQVLRERGATTTTLDHVLEARKAPPIDLITIDVEGAELLVLKGGTNAVDSAYAVICEASVESHLNQGASFDELVDFLDQKGFDKAGEPNDKNGNQLFLRRPM